MTQNYKRSGRRRGPMSGVSMLELLIAMAVLGIIVSVAMPSMSGFGANQRLANAAEQIYGHLQQARSESVARNAPTYVKFSADGTATWTYGVSVTDDCDLAVTDPTDADGCHIVVNDGDTEVDGIDADNDGDIDVDTGDRVLNRFVSADYNDVEMAIASFSSGNTQIEFDPVRGTSSDGEINLESSTGRRLRVEVFLLGRVEICSPDGSVDNYKTC